MILHRLFGEAKTVGDFLVGETLGDQRDQLLLAPRQSQTLIHARRGKRRRLTEIQFGTHSSLLPISNLPTAFPQSLLFFSGTPVLPFSRSGLFLPGTSPL
jgi:hypothetical protein